MFKLVTDFDILLDVEQILKGQGIEPERASARLVKMAEEALEAVRELIDPAALCGTMPVTDFQHESVKFAGGCFEGPLVNRSMAGASELNLALCTIGSRLEERMAELMPVNAMQAVALDGAGIAAIREVSRGAAELINADIAGRGLKAGMKVSPGQEGWPLEQQRVVFELVPAEKVGVRLTESCLMLPRKSVTFVIPAGTDMREDAIPCDFCSKRDRCKWRKENTD